MQEKGWDLGGENSGHIICLDQHTTGDGIVSALQVLEARAPGGQAPRGAGRRPAVYPQKLVNVRLARGFDWQRDAGIGRARAEAEAAPGERGRVLLRASGTEPVLRVMVEGEDAGRGARGCCGLAAVVERGERD